MWYFWSAKGGSGCTTVAAAAAVHSSKRTPTLMVDLAGDAHTVLGVDGPALGIRQWLAVSSPPPDALNRLELQAGRQLALLPAGPPTEAALAVGSAPLAGAPTDTELPPPSGECAPAWASDPVEGGWGRGERGRLLGALLRADGRCVIVDAGCGPQRDTLPTGADDRRYLVTRACYLSVVQAAKGPKPDGVIVLREPGRLLTDHDISTAVGAPVVVSLRWDPAVAAANDVGSLRLRLPRTLRRLGDLGRGDGFHD